MSRDNEAKFTFYIYNPTLVVPWKEGERRPDEDEEKDVKILYYSPSFTTQDEIRSQVSLTEGLVDFTRQFSDVGLSGCEEGGSSSKPLHSIKTKMHSFAIEEVEKDIWFTLVVRHPTITKRSGSKEGEKKGAGKVEVEYLEEVIHEDVLRSILRNVYTVFQLLHGRVSDYIDNYSRDKLVDLLEDYIPAFLETISYNMLESCFTNGIFYEMEGFQYAPVDRQTYTNIAVFLGKLCDSLGKICNNSSGGSGAAQDDLSRDSRRKRPSSNFDRTERGNYERGSGSSDIKAALFYDAHLIYSGIGLNDMKILYSYLVNMHNGQVSNTKLNKAPYGRIPTASNHLSGSSPFGRSHLIQGGTSGEANDASSDLDYDGNRNSCGGMIGSSADSEHFRGGQSSEFPSGATKNGSYLLGAEKGNGSIFIPKVFLSSGDVESQLVALCYKGALLILLFPPDVNIDNRILQMVQALATSPEANGEDNLFTLVPVIQRQFAMVMQQDDEYKFLYFNHANEALRISNHYMSGNAYSEGRDVGGDGRGNTGNGAGASMSNRLSSILQNITGNSKPGGYGYSPGDANGQKKGKEGSNLEHLFANNQAKELFLAESLHGVVRKDSSTSYREVCLKEAERGWICAKRSLEREFYLMLESPQMTLSKCQMECSRFSEIHFSNIYMM